MNGRPLPASPFAGRRLCIATMHHKEMVLRPVLERVLGVACVVPGAGFDTDRFGSFSGAVLRPGSDVEAARQKAEAGMAATGTDLAVASEGSFGPHPDAPMLACGMELVLLVDRKDGLVVAARELAPRTNHARQPLQRADEVAAFAARIGFPGHGVSLTVGEPTRATWTMAKSVRQLVQQAEQALVAAATSGDRCFANADMRAHRNPTRMQVIAGVAETLVAHVQRRCPACDTPGFGSHRSAFPRPCGMCGEPTRVAGDLVLHCLRCPHRELQRCNEASATADPGACDACNP